jgi:hypothetical protein
MIENIGLSGYTGPVVILEQLKDQKYTYYTLIVENKELFELYYLEGVWKGVKTYVIYTGVDDNEVEKILLSELQELLDISKQLWEINTIADRNDIKPCCD